MEGFGEKTAQNIAGIDYNSEIESTSEFPVNHPTTENRLGPRQNEANIE